MGSHHIPIILKFGNDNMNDNAFRPLCEFQTKNVDWTNYTSLALVNIEGDNIDQIHHNIKLAILNSAAISLPKVSRPKARILHSTMVAT